VISQSEARKRVAADLLALADRDAQAMSALAVLPHIDFAIVGFHAQQAVEKAMKAVMAAHGISFPKTHNLKELYDLLMENGHTLPLTIDQLNELTPYAVTSRYDLRSIDLLDKVGAQLAVEKTLGWARTSTALIQQK
jgi:HEPN domain-containing protein